MHTWRNITLSESGSRGKGNTLTKNTPPTMPTWNRSLKENLEVYLLLFTIVAILFIDSSISQLLALYLQIPALILPFIQDGYLRFVKVSPGRKSNEQPSTTNFWLTYYGQLLEDSLINTDPEIAEIMVLLICQLTNYLTWHKTETWDSTTKRVHYPHRLRKCHIACCLWCFGIANVKQILRGLPRCKILWRKPAYRCHWVDLPGSCPQGLPSGCWQMGRERAMLEW